MTIKGGALEFDIIANNGQINSALDETKRRVQGFTDATVDGGEKMELAFKQAADTIDKAFKNVDAMAGIHHSALVGLEKQYTELGEAAGAAFMKGTAKGDEEYRALTQRQAAVKDEITVRQKLLAEIENTADELAKEEAHLNDTKAKVDANSLAHKTFRTQLMAVREELVRLEADGKKNTDEYRAAEAEAARLAGAIANVNKQTQILGHNQGVFQGVISGISGVSGAFSAAQGAVSLFAGENEDLQRVMVKVQSLMAITIGLQQVSQTLHEKSAFSLKILGGVQKWWADVLAKATVTQVANTAATGTQAVAAKAGTIANIGLAGAFRLVGVAIKSIPVFGWILAGISGLIALVGGLTKKAREAKKATEELRKEVVEIAGKPVAAIQELSLAWDKLGNNLEAKKKFVQENTEKFKELGVSVKSVEEAENLLIKHKDAFINSEIAKAKAMAVRAQAADLVAKVLDNQQKLEEAQKTPTVTRYVSGGSFGPGYSYEIANPKIAKFEERDKEYQEQITKLYTNAANYELDGLKILEAAGIQGTQEYQEGTVGALEQAIATKQTLLKGLSDPEAYKAALAEIEAIQKQVDAITGGSKKTKKKETDPFTEMLEERKKKYQQYLKWVNSDDEIVRTAAKTEFSGLLAEGNNYLDYLKKQREQLLELSKHTPTQLKNLAKLNDEIAAETKNTVLGQFEQELQAQLNGARSIMEMLNVLEERRKQLAGDGSDLDNGKTQLLDNAQTDVAKKAEDETNALLQTYAAYLSEKINFDLEYGEKRRLLNERLAKASAEEERRIVLAALAALEKDREKYGRQTGNEDYDKLVEEYRSYSQRRADISAEYDEKIAVASEQQNAELVQRLIEAKNRAVSSVALEELQASGAWEKLFGNLDDLTTKQIEALIAKIEGQRAQLGVELDPKDIEAILSKLEDAKDVIRERNPFKALRDGLKAYKQDANKANLTKVFEGVAGSLDLVKGSFDAVVGGLDKMGLAGDEVTQKLLGDISEMVGAAGQLATGIASGNPLQIIQGAMGFISSAFEVFNFRDRKAERAIKKHAEAVKALERAYKSLEYAVHKALGTAEYEAQIALVKNLQQQQKHLNSMINAERDKKKTDGNKINDYKGQIEDLGRQIEDILQEVRDNILQTTAKTFANDLGNALAEAFGKGEDAAKAFDKTVNEVMKNAVLNQLKKKFLEEQLEGALDGLYNSMGYWTYSDETSKQIAKLEQKIAGYSSSNKFLNAILSPMRKAFEAQLNALKQNKDSFVFDGLSQAEQDDFKNKVGNIADQYKEALKVYEDLFKDLGESEDPMTSLSGAIKGASQESIDLLAGQTNAVRINQVEGIEIMRQQLFHLASIDAKAGVSNKHLASIDDKLKANNSDPLRAQGLT